MNRRGFLKRASALAVSAAFPLPVPAAPSAFKLDAEFLQAFSNNAMVLFIEHGTGYVSAHSFGGEDFFCTRCGRAAEEIYDRDIACI